MCRILGSGHRRFNSVCRLVGTYYVTWHDDIPNLSSFHLSYKGNIKIIAMEEERIHVIIVWEGETGMT